MLAGLRGHTTGGAATAAYSDRVPWPGIMHEHHPVAGAGGMLAAIRALHAVRAVHHQVSHKICVLWSNRTFGCTRAGHAVGLAVCPAAARLSVRG